MRFVGATFGVGIGQAAAWLVWGSISIISASTSVAQVTASELSLLWMPSGTIGGSEHPKPEVLGQPSSRPRTSLVLRGNPAFLWGGSLAMQLGGFSIDAHRAVWRTRSQQPLRIQLAWGAPYLRGPMRVMQRLPLRRWSLGLSTVRYSAPARPGTPMSTSEMWLRRNGVMLIVRPSETIVHLRPQWGSIWLYADPRRGIVRGGSADVEQHWGELIATIHGQFWPSPTSHEATARVSARWPTKPQASSQNMIRLSMRTAHHQLQTLSYTIARRSGRWGGSLDHAIQPHRTLGVHSLNTQGFVRATRIEVSGGLGYSWPHVGWHWTSQGRFAPTQSLVGVRGSQTALEVHWRQRVPRTVPGNLTLSTKFTLVRPTTRSVGSADTRRAFSPSPIRWNGYRQWDLTVDGATNVWSFSAGAQFDLHGASLSLSARRRSRQARATWRWQHFPNGTWQSRALWTIRGDHHGSPGQDTATGDGAGPSASDQPFSPHRAQPSMALSAILVQAVSRSTAQLFPARVHVHVRDPSGEPVAATVFYGMKQRRTNAAGRVTFKDAQSGDQLWVQPDDPLLHVPERHQGAKLGRRTRQTIIVHPMRWLHVSYAAGCPQETNPPPHLLPPHWRPPSTVSIPFTPEFNRPSVTLGLDEQQRIALRSDHPFWLLADQHHLPEVTSPSDHLPGTGREAILNPSLTVGAILGTNIGRWTVSYDLRKSAHATTLHVYACPQPAPILWQP